MDKAIKIHCMHCAVYQVVPIISKPKTVITAFQELQGEGDEIVREMIFDVIHENTLPPFATFGKYFEGGGYYRDGIPQADEIHTDEDGKKHRIVGYFSENFCEN